MRPLLIYLMLLSFVVLGLCDIAAGHWRTGVASILLAIANALLLTT